MLNSIKFLKDFRCFKKGDTFSFPDGVTLLVGEQGCGKSSLLKMLADDGGAFNRDEYLKVDLTEAVEKNSAPLMYFDCERHNPRVSEPDPNNAETYATYLMSRFVSHGEAILPILSYVAKATVPTVFLIDEPDMALSIRSIGKLVKAFKKAAKAGHQIVASAHNPFLIMGFKQVYSLEHRKMMTSDDFIKAHQI